MNSGPRPGLIKRDCGRNPNRQIDAATSTSSGGETELKYMIMTFGDRSGLEEKSPEWIKGMIAFMRRIDVELEASGGLSNANARLSKATSADENTPRTAS
jgi:hypothetical protein